MYTMYSRCILYTTVYDCIRLYTMYTMYTLYTLYSSTRAWDHACPLYRPLYSKCMHFLIQRRVQRAPRCRRRTPPAMRRPSTPGRESKAARTATDTPCQPSDLISLGWPSSALLKVGHVVIRRRAAWLANSRTWSQTCAACSAQCDPSQAIGSAVGSAITQSLRRRESSRKARLVLHFRSLCKRASTRRPGRQLLDGRWWASVASWPLSVWNLSHLSMM